MAVAMTAAAFTPGPWTGSMWREWIPFWHAGISPYGGDVDLLFTGLLLASALVLGLLFLLLALFCIRYRAGNPVDRGDRVTKSWHWEVGWTAASLVCFLGLFVWGAVVFLEIYQTPPDELSVFVVAKQWMWKVQHAGGQAEINALHIPVDRPIRLVMASQDVIHSFFIPALRLKHDVIPGRYQDARDPGQQARALPPVLRGILRDRPFRHDRRGRRDGASRFHRLARRASSVELARSGGWRAVQGIGMQRVPRHRQQGSCAATRRALRQAGAAFRRNNGGCGRQIHPRFDTAAAQSDRRRL